MRRSDPTAPRLRWPAPGGAFDAAFRAAYEGSLDPDEALWWLQHPDDPGPLGVLPLSRTAEDARRSLYSGGQPADLALRHTKYTRALADYWQEAALAARAGLTAMAATRPRMLPWAGRLLVAAAACTVGAAVAAGLTPRAPAIAHPSAAADSSPTAASAPLPLPTALPEISAVGAVILRMSDQSPRIGGELAQSGTSAFQSDLVRPSGPLALSVRCTGGSRLVVIVGQDGLNDGGFAILDCPDASTATVTTVLPAAATSTAFRVVVVEEQPVTWRVVLSRFHST